MVGVGAKIKEKRLRLCFAWQWLLWRGMKPMKIAALKDWQPVGRQNDGEIILAVLIKVKGDGEAIAKNLIREQLRNGMR